MQNIRGNELPEICMDLVHSGGFRFGDGFGYTYLITSHGILSPKSQVRHGYLHVNTLGRQDLDLCLELG